MGSLVQSMSPKGIEYETLVRMTEAIDNDLKRKTTKAYPYNSSSQSFGHKDPTQNNFKNFNYNNNQNSNFRKFPQNQANKLISNIENDFAEEICQSEQPNINSPSEIPPYCMANSSQSGVPPYWMTNWQNYLQQMQLNNPLNIPSPPNTETYQPPEVPGYLFKYDVNTPKQERKAYHCDYCYADSHTQDRCFLYKARQKSPNDVWCERCKHRNHTSDACKASIVQKGKQNQTHHVTVVKSFHHNKLEKISKSEPSHKVNISIHNNSKLQNKKFQKCNQKGTKYCIGPRALLVNIRQRILDRIERLTEPLKTKVMTAYNNNKSKYNYQQCPHPSISQVSGSNKLCQYCIYGDPDVLALERIILTFSSNKITINTNDADTIHEHRTVDTLSTPTTLPATQVSTSPGCKSEVKDKVNKNTRFIKDLTKSLGNGKVIKHMPTAQKDNSEYSPKRMSTNTINESYTDKVYNAFSKLNNDYNPGWTNELDNVNDPDIQVNKRLEFYDNGKKIVSFAGSGEFKNDDLVMVHSLENPVSRPLIIHNVKNQIKIENDVFTNEFEYEEPNFWINIDNELYLSLVDSGSEESSVREDIVEKLKVPIIPLRPGELNYSICAAGKIPILGRAELNIKFLDIEVGPHIFKIFPKNNNLTDQIVLGQDFLIKKKLKYFGYKNLLRGYLPNGKPWSYHSDKHQIRRTLCDIECKLNKQIILDSGESTITKFKFDCSQYFTDENLNLKDSKISGATQLHIVKVIGSDDSAIEGANTDNNIEVPEYYTINIEQPFLELHNVTNNTITHEQNELVGHLYTIKTIHIQVPFPAHLLIPDDKFVTPSAVEKTELSSEIKQGFVKQDIEASHTIADSETNNLGVNESAHEMNEQEYTSDFNPPDEPDLKEENEWTKEDLYDSINVGGSPENQLYFKEMMWDKYKSTVSNAKTVPPSILEPVKFIKKSDKIVNTPQYKFSHAISQEIEGVIKEMLEAKIIEPTTSLYNNPLHLVRKKDGTARVVIDMRSVNAELALPVPSPLITVERVMSDLNGSKIYSQLDLLCGFHQLLVHPESRPLTAFTSTHRYQYVRLPFGCSQSPIEFSRLLNLALADLLQPMVLSGDKGVPTQHFHLYVDDILVNSSNEQDHLELLNMLFNKLKENHLKLKLPKCFFMQPSVTFLGFNFSESGVKKGSGLCK
ncbi:unnamed protein product [Rotaria magnacalcarata]|uniref:Reverse transcriptase domain-containing protein n=1 Tax=Rotaria magnacalcarata TaxID=392030 RepID=A0A816VV82_9BILA|nr:unnamed protein product [Rotaria magnacalcarata]CAF4270950.1 unnamed protein product [Rotaria magnacalcarata]